MLECAVLSGQTRKEEHGSDVRPYVDLRHGIESRPNGKDEEEQKGMR
jgi:hypothetical protein